MAKLPKVQEVGEQCAALRARMAARGVTRAYDAALRPVGLKITQFTLLVSIAHDADLSIGKLADHLAMERTTLTRNLQLLEKEGLIEMRKGRQPRTKVPMLTRDGAARLKQALPLWRKAQDRVVAHMGAADWKAGTRVLERLAHTPAP